MSKHDEFDDPKGSDLLGSIGPKAAFFIVLIALSFMIGVVWKLYVGGGSSNPQNVPIIRGDVEPYKVEPEEAGGMEVPYKDSTIFSSLNSDPDADKGIENLLADDEDETPVPRSQLFAGLNTQANPDLHAEAQETPLDQPLTEDQERIVNQVKEAERVVTSLVEDGADAINDAENGIENFTAEIPKKVEPTVIEVTESEGVQKIEVKPASEIKSDEAVVKEIPTPVVEVKPEPKVEPKPVTKVEPKPEPVKQAVKPVEKKVEPKAAPKPKVVASGDYYVQVASVQDKSRAAAEWSKINKKFGSALAGYKYRVETANLAKGTYHRIQAGPVSKSQANATCAAIKRIDANGCLIKKK